MGTKTLLKNQLALIGTLLLSSLISETSKAATTMWQQNSVWMFAFQSEYPNWIHDTCIERWSVYGDTIINGQTYHNLYRDYSGIIIILIVLQLKDFGAIPILLSQRVMSSVFEKMQVKYMRLRVNI